MKRVLLLVLVTIIVSGLLLAGCAKTPKTTTVADTGQTYNLKFSYHTPPQASMVGAYFQPWTAAIEQATGGRVKITHYAGESLVKAKDQYDALVSGLSDIALVDPSETPGRFPQTEFDTLPYIFPDTTIGAKVYWDVLQKYIVNKDLKDVVVLAVCVIAPSNYAGNKPAKNIADFKGNRVRSSARTEGWTIEALGGTPIEVATSDLYTALERGTIDSGFLSWSLIMSSGLKDVTKYATECNLFYRAWPIVINKKVWDSMPPNIQKAIMDASGRDNSANYCTANEKLAAGAKGGLAGAYKAAGKEPIYTLTAEQTASWKAAVLPVWDKWAADLEAKKLPGKAIIADTKTLVTQYSPK
jgi:TRAP-type C4-dicarboxylate transport system substrate-binding protein